MGKQQDNFMGLVIAVDGGITSYFHLQSRVEPADRVFLPCVWWSHIYTYTHWQVRVNVQGGKVD